ncbi:hypothetical protein AXK11_03670 [Cephaloticoccus primus]|uniref:Sel1 repeat family protein n=2 Tax=Cephaloticoccus primus TaxID=1548207 RepID=A0A139SQ33_9BACT|nr:hypothetical protein AXK11_03670 [Cephaloticoccus primus]
MLEQDPAKADNGTGKGFYRLGEFFENGLDSLKPDLREAIHWYRKAATQHNHLHAQLTLGLIYLAEVKRGVTGSASNYAEAARWLRKAADQGHPEAQVLLAVMHLEGLGVRESESEAEAWLEKANQDGLAVSKDALRERLQITPFRDWDFAQWRVWR